MGGGDLQKFEEKMENRGLVHRDKYAKNDEKNGGIEKEKEKEKDKGKKRS